MSGNALPWLLVIAMVGGLGYALWLRAARPQRYASLARVEIRADEDEQPIAEEPRFQSPRCAAQAS